LRAVRIQSPDIKQYGSDRFLVVNDQYIQMLSISDAIISR